MCACVCVCVCVCVGGGCFISIIKSTALLPTTLKKKLDPRSHKEEIIDVNSTLKPSHPVAVRSCVVCNVIVIRVAQ